MTHVLALALAAIAAMPAADAVKAADAAMNSADFAAALTILEGLDTQGARISDLEAAALLRAECLMALKRPAEADAAYANAVVLNPSVKLGPTAPTKLVAALEQVRAKLVGTLTLQSGQPAAMALIDGKRVGPLPVSVQLIVGTHRVQLESEETPREVEVRAGQTTDVVLEVPAKAVAAPPTQRSPLPVALLVGGAAAIAGGSALLAHSFTWRSNIAQMTLLEAKVAREQAGIRHGLGIGVAAVGGVAALVGVVLMASGDAEPPVVIAPAPGGAMVGVRGSF